MPQLLSLETENWTLTVWSHDIAHAQRLLGNTLSSKGKALPESCFRFNPPLYLINEDAVVDSYVVSSSPLFFENKLYEFDFQFQANRKISEARVKHRLRRVEEAFHSIGNSLRGSLNFGNHIGWFKLEITYRNHKNKLISQKISFEVLPTKMDLAEDISHIHQVIDKQYPLLRFSFVQKTEQELARSRKPHERFPLLWLSHFQSLRLELEKAIKHILHNPHSRLLSYDKKYRAEQLRGRLSPRLEESVAASLINNNLQVRYKVKSRTLSRDTPENRFIKMVLSRCSRELSLFLQRAKENNAIPEKSILSESFFNELGEWKTPLDRYLQQPFFGDIGTYDGLSKESLVLHQKQGYAHVYRIWQQLKLYLDVFAKQANISMKSIAELYEIWCVLEVRRILIDDLGFIEKKSHKASLYDKSFEKKLHDGMGSAFYLQREEITIRLAHEPIFRLSNNHQVGKIYSWTTNQKPDILLEAEFPSGETVRWIFDAKYRISPDQHEVDLAPDDAINQMHRYRDALIYIHEKTDHWKHKQRPIFGAFVLYPGFFDEEQADHPYAEAVTEVGIGAFPLLPNAKNIWLKKFLKEQLGSHIEAYPQANTEYLSVQEAPRIGYTGLELSRYRDLTLAVALGGKCDKAYKKRFQQGLAKWYHLPHQTVVKNNIQTTIMKEVRFCAFVVHHKGNKQRNIEFIYPIKSVQLLLRKDISQEQAGAIAKADRLNNQYWLFELGVSRQVKSHIKVGGLRDFKFRLVGADDLEKSQKWSDLSDYYAFLQKA